MRSVKGRAIKNQLFKVLLICTFTCILTTVSRADDGDDPGNDPDAVPLDGGVVTLIVAGVGYGIKKMRDAKQQKAKQSNLSSTTSYEDMSK